MENNDKNMFAHDTILIVEDDKFLADLLRKKLENHGAEILYANSGEASLDALENKKPSLIIIDILLPGIDGLEALKKIRMEDQFKAVPAILLSNLEPEENEKRLAGLSNVNLLTKSEFNLDELVVEIAKILERKTQK